jgi:hypothetical protein
MNCTIDASVFVASVRLEEKHYAEIEKWLKGGV